MDYNLKKWDAQKKYEEEFGVSEKKAYDASTFDSDLKNIYEDQLRFSAFRSKEYINSKEFQKQDQKTKDLLLAEYYDVSTSNQDIVVPRYDASPSEMLEMSDSERAKVLSQGIKTNRGVSDNTLDLMFENFIDARPDYRNKSDEELSNIKYEYLKGYTYANDESHRDKLNNILSSPDLENLFSTAKARSSKGVDLYNRYTELRKIGGNSLRTPAGQALVQEAIEIGKSLPENKSFEPTDDAKRRVYQGGVIPKEQGGGLKSGGAVYDFLSEASGAFGQSVREFNTNSQRSDFLEAIQNVDLEGLIESEMNRGIEMAEIPTTYVNKNETWWASLGQQMGGMKELGVNLVSGDKKAQTWRDLARGMLEDKNGVLGFVAGYGGASAFARIAKLSRYSKVAAAAKLRGKAIPSKSMLSKMGGFAGESVTSAVAGSLPVALDEAELAIRMKTGIKNFAFINTMIQDAVMGYPMDLATTGIKKLTLDPTVKGVKKVRSSKKKKQQEKLQSQLNALSAFDNPVYDGLLQANAGITTKSNGSVIKINFDDAPKLKDRKSKVIITKDYLKTSTDKEMQATLTSARLSRLDKYYNSLGEELGDYEKKLSIIQEQEIAKAHYEGLGSAFDKNNPNEDTYLTGVATDIEVDGSRKYIYDNQGLWDYTRDYVPTRNITSVRTDKLKTAIENKQSSTGNEAQGIFEAYLFNEELNMARSKFYETQSMNPKAFENTLIFSTKVKTQQRRPINLTGVTRKEGYGIGSETRADQARARSLRSIGISEPEIEGILPKLEMGGVKAFPVLPLFSMLKNRSRRFDKFSTLLENKKELAVGVPISELSVMKNNLLDDANTIGSLFDQLEATNDLVVATELRKEIDEKVSNIVPKLNVFDNALDTYTSKNLKGTDFQRDTDIQTDKILSNEVESDASDLDGLVEVAQEYAFTELEVTEHFGMVLTSPGDKGGAVIAEAANQNKQVIDAESEVKAEPVLDKEGNQVEEALPDTEETHKTVEKEEAAELAKDQARQDMAEDNANVEKSVDYSEEEKLNHKLKTEHNPEPVTPPEVQAEAEAIIADVKSSITKGDNFEVSAGGRTVRFSHLESGNLAVTTLDADGSPVREYIYQDDGKVLYDDGTKKAANSNLLKKFVARRDLSEADLARSFGVSPKVFAEQPFFSAEVQKLASEYRASMFKLVDDIRAKKFTDAKQIESMYRDLLTDKELMVRKVVKFAEDYDMPTQTSALSALGHRVKFLDEASASINSYKRAVKDKKLESKDARLGAFNQAQVKIQKALGTGSKNANASDLGIRTKIAETSRKIEAYLDEGRFDKADSLMNTLFTDFKQFKKGYISNGSTQTKMFENKEKSKEVIVNQRDLSADDYVIENNVISRLLLDRNLGLPNLMSTDRLISKIYGMINNAKGGGLHGNMTKIPALGDLGGGIFWVDQDRPVYNLKGAQARLLKEIGAERSMEGTEMINLRYKIEGKSGYKAQGTYDTMYGQVAMPISEFARLIQDPTYNSPQVYADLSGTHRAPTNNPNNPHILNSTYELKKTSPEYAKTELALHTYAEGTYLSKDIVNNLFTRADGTFDYESSFEVEVRSKEEKGAPTIKGKLKLMSLGSRRMPVFIEEQHLRGAKIDDNTRLDDGVVEYHYPIQGDLATVKFMDAVNIEKYKGVNHGVGAAKAKLQYDNNARKAIETTEVIDTNESATIPTEAVVPVTNTVKQQLDGMESVRGAIEEAFFEIQSDNPDVSMMFYGDAGNVMVPKSKNVWIRKGIGEGKDFLDRLPQDVKSAENGNANLKIVNLVALNKKGTGFNARSASKTILNDVSEGDVYVISHKGTEISDDFHEALSKKGVTYSGRIETAGDASYSVYSAGGATANSMVFKGSGELKSTLKSLLSGNDPRKPKETLAKGEVRIDHTVSEIYSRGDDSFVNMAGHKEFTSLSSFDAAKAIVAEEKLKNPNAKFTIKVSKKSESQTIKTTIDPADIVPELNNNSTISINNNPIGLRELNQETLLKLANKLELKGEGLEAFLATLSKNDKAEAPTNRDIEHQLALSMDKKGNINDITVYEKGSVKFESSDDFLVSVGKQQVGQDRIVIDARVMESEPRAAEVPEEIYRATNTNGVGAIAKTKKMIEDLRTAFDSFSTKVDGDEHPKADARSTAGIILKDPNLMTLVDRFFKDSNNNTLLEVENHLNRIREQAKALPPEGQVKLEQGLSEIWGTLLNNLEPVGLDKKLGKFQEGMKKKTSQAVMQDFNTRTADMIGQEDTNAGFRLFREEGVSDSMESIRDAFGKTLFQQKKKLDKRENLFLGRITNAYAHYAGKLAQGLADSKRVDIGSLTKQEKLIIADAAMDMLQVNILEPGSLNAKKSTTAFLEGYAKGNLKLQSNLGFANKKLLAGGFAAFIAATALTKLGTSIYQSDALQVEDDEIMKDESIEHGFFHLGNSNLVATGLAIGALGFGAGHRMVKKKINPSIGEGVKMFGQSAMHWYGGTKYAGTAGTMTMHQWLTTAPEKSIRNNIARQLGQAETLSQMSTNQLDGLIERTSSKYKTQAEQDKYLELLERVSQLTNQYAGSEMSVMDRVKNAYADLNEKYPGLYSDDMIIKSSYVTDYIENTRQVAYDAELLDANQQLRTNYVVSGSTLDKDAVISEFHVGPGLDIDELKMTQLLERGISDAKSKGYDFTENEIGAILINDYGAVSGPSFSNVKETIANILKSRDPKGSSRSIDYYLNDMKLLPKTPAEIASSILSQNGKGTQINPEGARLDIYNTNNNKSLAGFVKNFDRLAKQIHYGTRLELDNPAYLAEVIKDMPEGMSDEFFANLRMDIGTNYLERVKVGEISSATDVNKKDMADYSNNANLQNFQAFQAQSKLAVGFAQGPMEFTASAIQTAIYHGFGNYSKQLVKTLLTKTSHETYVAVRNFQTAVHSSNADQGFNHGSRALLSRFAENSKTPSYDIYTGIMGEKVKGKLDGVFGDFFNEEIVVSNKMATLLDLPAGARIPRKYLHQGRAGFNMFYRAMNGAGAMVAYDLGKSSFDGIASRYKMDKSKVTASEMSMLKTTFSDQEIELLGNLDPNNKTEQIMLDRMAMRYAVAGVQNVTGISGTAMKKLRSSTKKGWRWTTTFRQAPANVFHAAWNHILMPALEGDTKLLARMIVGSGIFGAFAMSKIKGILGLEEDKDVSQIDRSAFVQALTYHLSHMATSIPSDVFLGIAGVIDDPNRTQNWRQALRQVAGSSPSSMVNGVYTGAEVGYHSVAALFDEPEAHIDEAMDAIGKFAKSESKLVREVNAFQKYAFTDDVAHQSTERGFAGLLQEMEMNFSRKKLPEMNLKKLIPESPAYVQLSSVAFKKFREATESLQSERKTPEVSLLESQAKVLKEQYPGEHEGDADRQLSNINEDVGIVKRQDKKRRMETMIKEHRTGGSTK